jgi:Ca2+/H+ antiporter
MCDRGECGPLFAAPGAQISLIDEHLSLSVSVVLLVLYVGNQAYILVTHRDVFAQPRDRFAHDSALEGAGFELPVPQAQVCSGEDVTCPGGGGPTADPRC